MVHMHISTYHGGHFVRILSFKKFRLHKVVEEEEELKKERSSLSRKPERATQAKVRVEKKKRKGEKLAEPKTRKGDSDKS